MKDFRNLIEYLEANDKIVKIHKEVNPEYELTEVAKQAFDKFHKAVLFDKVKDSKFPVISYALPDRETIAAGLNMEQKDMVKEWSSREANRSPYTLVEKGAANEVIDLDPNLFELPLGIHSQDNGGKYITGGIIIAKHPELDMQNASYNRCQLVDKKKLHVRMMPPQHLGLYFDEAEKRNQPLEIAIVIGGPCISDVQRGFQDSF